MFSTSSQSPYLERAEMHEKLADATSDGPARKMHLAMAAEYRRRAAADASGDRSDATTKVIEPMQHRREF
jgi:hypothetical protein